MGNTQARFRYRLPLFVSAALMTLAGCSEQPAPGPAGAQMPPPAVDVVVLSSAPLEITDLLPGRVSAFRTAEIRPQVSGILQRRFFEEGATVKAGDKLYQIDPTLYQAQLASAEAQLAVAEANAYSAKLRAERYAKLAKSNAISEQELIDAQANSKQTEAQVKAAQAAVRSARINLSYTEITAPIPGVISRSNITEGALVSAQQANALTTIRQLSPVYVDIQRPAASLNHMKSGKLSHDVVIEDDQGSKFEEVGKLQFSDVSVDQGTGTVNVRALFQNEDKILLPGMFVRANVPSAFLEKALLVPQRAVMRQANATIVMAVSKEDTVEARPIQVSRAIGDQWLVTAGLFDGDRVIVSGLQKAQPGTKVSPVDVTDAQKQ